MASGIVASGYANNNITAYTCPAGKTFSGKLLLSLVAISTVGNIPAKTLININNSSFVVSFGQGISYSENNTIINTHVVLPIILSEGQTIKLDQGFDGNNNSTNTQYIITGYEE